VAAVRDGAHGAPIMADRLGLAMAVGPWITAGGVARDPAGAVAGMMGRRARQDGAWAPPAGVVLGSVTALVTAPAQPAEVNHLTAVARGVQLSSQRTLSDDPDLIDVHVRRLVHLLRRHARRLGEELAFEPNSDEANRRIRRSFERTLQAMWQRGAFSGTSAPDSFRTEVVTADLESGVLTFEVKFDPAATTEAIVVDVRRSTADLPAGAP